MRNPRRCADGLLRGQEGPLHNAMLSDREGSDRRSYNGSRTLFVLDKSEMAVYISQYRNPDRVARPSRRRMDAC
jgi:hypothetical protein